MQCQILFPGKSRENISICCLLKILPRALNVKLSPSPDELFKSNIIVHVNITSKATSVQI